MNLSFSELIKGTQEIGIVNVLILTLVLGVSYYVTDVLKRSKAEEARHAEEVLRTAEENARSTAESIREVKDMVFTINATLSDLYASTRETLTFMRMLVTDKDHTG